MNKRTSILIVLSLALAPSISMADVTHYKNILVGDRSATMAGAYVALSDDSSGCYYNPAGISYTTGANLSGSVNAYHIQDSTYENAIRGNSWKRDSAELLPNFFGLIKNFGRHSLGLSVVVPDSFEQHQDQVLENLPITSAGQEAISRYTLNMHVEDATNLAGISYAYELSPTLAAGLTLSYYHRKNRIGNSQTILFGDNTSEGSFYNSSWMEEGIYPKLGVRWEPHRKLSLGLTISQVFLYSSKWDAMTNVKERGNDTFIYSKTTLKRLRHTSFELGVGIALYPTEYLTFTFDTNLFTDPGKDIYSPYGYDPVINFSMGGEFLINKNNVIRLGYFTNNSSSPTPSESTRNIEHIDMWGLATGYSLHGQSTSFTIGVIYSKGNGTSQIYDNSSAVINVKRYSLTGLLSTNYKL